MCEQAILLGVPKVEYGPNGVTPFPMCLKACANYLGQDVGYDYVMAASGAAFRLTWNTQAWDGGNVDVVFTFDEPTKIFRLGIEALGCEYNLIGRSRETKKTEFIDFIRSKDRRRHSRDRVRHHRPARGVRRCRIPRRRRYLARVELLSG